MYNRLVRIAALYALLAFYAKAQTPDISNATIVIPASAASVEAMQPGDAAWNEFVTKLAQPSTDPAASNADATAALATADAAKAFYTAYPDHAKANEARRLEALLLLDAVAAGDAQTAARMQSTVQAFRADTSVPSAERAIVAGSYEFQTARERIHTVDDMAREYEAVARALMKEFPDQPQGFVSLLTQSMNRDTATARAMADEVSNSTGPAFAKAQARRLVTRIDLLAQAVDVPFGDLLTTGTKNRWSKGKPGIIYFWATWNSSSIALGDMLATRSLSGVNVVGVCLDVDGTAAAAVATSHRFPGRQIYVPQGLNGDLAVKLGAFEAPALYLTDSNGVIRDVRGLEKLDAKLAALGL
jgi:hypothetical protein